MHFSMPGKDLEPIHGKMWEDNIANHGQGCFILLVLGNSTKLLQGPHNLNVLNLKVLPL
jgi:hypothetical protein